MVKFALTTLLLTATLASAHWCGQDTCPPLPSNKAVSTQSGSGSAATPTDNAAASPSMTPTATDGNTAATSTSGSGSATATSTASGAPRSYETATAQLDSGDIRGNVTFQGSTHPGIMVHFDGLNPTNGPFQIHIHDYAVVNGNCSTTGGHLDPYNIGTKPGTPGNLTSYQVGDLSGKYGNITAESSKLTDSDTTFNISEIIGRSVVLHNGTGARIACGDIYGVDSSNGQIVKDTTGYPVTDFPGAVNVNNGTNPSVTGAGNGASPTSGPNSTETPRVGAAGSLKAAMGLVAAGVVGVVAQLL